MPPLGYKRLSDAQADAIVRGHLAGRSNNSLALEQKTNRSTVGRLLKSERATPFFAAERKRQRARERATQSRLEAAQRRTQAPHPPATPKRTRRHSANFAWAPWNTGGPPDEFFERYENKPTPEQVAQQERRNHEELVAQMRPIKLRDGSYRISVWVADPPPPNASARGMRLEGNGHWQPTPCTEAGELLPVTKQSSAT